MCQILQKLSYFCTTKTNKKHFNHTFSLMRKSLIYVSALMLAMCMGVSSCKDKKGSEGADKTPLPVEKSAVSNDSLRQSPLAAYIRYVDTDRILTEYTLAREVAQADSAAQIQLAALQNQLSNNLNSRAQQIQEKAQRNGYINEAAYNADLASLQKAQQDAENRMAQRQRDYATDMMNKQAQMHDSLKSVIDDICREMQLDAVLNAGAGLYFNPTLDITTEVVNELNRRYKPAK